MSDRLDKEKDSVLKTAAKQGVSRSISVRIFRLIMVTAGGLSLFSVLTTAYMFYRESRHIVPVGGGHDEATAVLMRYIPIYLILMLCAALAIAYVMKRYAARFIVEPIDQICEAVSGYITDKSDGTLDDKHFDKLEVNSGDELEHLALVLRDMEHSLQSYLDNLTRVTREKERISTELDLARRIQFNMLPNVFPPYPDRKEFDIYASMDPAKEVGGDFYDFFLLDSDHLGMVMADVSGKGIPAALFMMMARIMIHSMAITGASPKTVLESVNEKICEHNDEEMFVTVWMGVLTISTGRVIAVNAGHEYPFLKGPDTPFELKKDVHGFVVGGMEGMHYREYSFTLEKGGTLFLYTDGLPEASDSRDELFGTKRVLEVLNANQDAGPEELLNEMTAQVNRFVGKAPQFDDLTMMAVRLNDLDDLDETASFPLENP